MRHFLILMMVVLVVLLTGDCKTTGTSGGSSTSNLSLAPTNWDGIMNPVVCESMFLLSNMTTKLQSWLRKPGQIGTLISLLNYL